MATKKKSASANREPPKLDMFNKVLPSADSKIRGLYQSLDDDERKSFSAWLTMRYLSSVESSKNVDIETYLIYTNEFLNLNFSDIKDDEFKWLLMTVVGRGRNMKHPYLAPPGGKKKKKNPFRNWLQELHPHLGDQEMDIWLSNLDKKSAKDMLEQYHIKDKDIIASANDL